jgi:hypothetical protein
MKRFAMARDERGAIAAATRRRPRLYAARVCVTIIRGDERQKDVLRALCSAVLCFFLSGDEVNR